GDSSPSGFTAFNNELYFSANNGGNGFELWKVRADGSVVLVHDIDPGAASSFPSGFTVLNTALYFSADDGPHGTELWKVQGDGSVVQSFDIVPGGGSSFPSGFTVLATSTPSVTASLANDTGSSSTDGITSNDTLTGSGDPNAVVHFTV